MTTISGRRWLLTRGIKLVILKCLQSFEYLQALGQAIGCMVNKGIQDGLKAGVDHGKAGRDMYVVEAYDPSAKEKMLMPGEVKEKRLSLTDVMNPLVEPLSSKSLTGEASTSAAPITTLSTTFASSAVVLPSSVFSDQVLDAEPHNDDPPPVTFEKEELGTSPG
ncbi:hypothetical protein Tco_0669042 [Tanacetum coccineum]